MGLLYLYTILSNILPLRSALRKGKLKQLISGFQHDQLLIDLWK